MTFGDYIGTQKHELDEFVKRNGYEVTQFDDYHFHGPMVRLSKGNRHVQIRLIDIIKQPISHTERFVNEKMKELKEEAAENDIRKSEGIKSEIDTRLHRLVGGGEVEPILRREPTNRSN